MLLCIMLRVLQPHPSGPLSHTHCYSPGQRQVLDDIGVGQAIFLLTGLPPFLRVRELRPKNRGDLLPGGIGCVCIEKIPLTDEVVIVDMFWQLGDLGRTNWQRPNSALNRGMMARRDLMK